MSYSLHNLTPDALDNLRELVVSANGQKEFLQNLRSFLLGGKASAADRDSAFSLASELSAYGIFDIVSVSELTNALSNIEGDKLYGFKDGLPRKVREQIAQGTTRHAGALRPPKSSATKSIAKPVVSYAARRAKGAYTIPKSIVAGSTFIPAELDEVRARLALEGFTLKVKSPRNKPSAEELLAGAKESKVIASYSVVRDPKGGLKGYLVKTHSHAVPEVTFDVEKKTGQRIKLKRVIHRATRNKKTVSSG